MTDTLEQVFALALQRQAQCLRVGQEEICGRKRVSILLQIEMCALAGNWIEPGCMFCQVEKPFRSNEIGLFDRIQNEVFVPAGVAEALVCWSGLRRPSCCAFQQA